MAYVTPQQLTTQIAKPNLVNDARVITCCESAEDLINDWIGVPFSLDPVPSTVRMVALSLAVDLWKQADATFGVLGIGETGPVRIARDLLNRYDSLLIPYYDRANGWGVA